MAKTILAAGIVRDIRFPSIEDLERYLERFEFNGVEYVELERCYTSRGDWLLRVVTQYNNTPLIDLT